MRIYLSLHSLVFSPRSTYLEGEGNLEILKIVGEDNESEPFIEVNTSFKATSNYDFNFFGSGTGTIPNQIPLIGGLSVTGNIAVDYSSDGILSNDYAAIWAEYNPSIFGVEIGPIVIGVKGYLDFSFERIGARNIPQPATFAFASATSNISPTNSFMVEPGLEWVLLSADWENDTNNTVAVRITAPDGSIYTEDQFADTGRIAVVDELTDSNTKAVAVLNPEAGMWNIEVIDSTSLGAIQYIGVQDSEAPTIKVTAPNKDVKSSEVTIRYNAFDADSDAKISLFYDDDNQGFDGILIADDLAESDGSGSFLWNTEGVPTGNYFVYAMVIDENNPPAFSYSKGRVQVSNTREADLSVTQMASADSIDIDSNLTYTVAVTNNGPNLSKDVTLTETLPEGATFVSASLTPVEQSGNILKFNLGDLANGAQTNVQITVIAPTILGNITGSALVDSRTYDPDITNSAALLDTLVTNTQSLPEIIIYDVSLEEGDSGTTDFIFNVSLSKASTEIVTIDYQTVDKTAKAGEDYTATSGTLEFAPGETEKAIAVEVVGDTELEPNETFFVNLNRATKAAILAPQGVGTIQDKLSLSINDVTLTEGDLGTTNATFTISLSAASTETVTVGYTTVDSTAKAGNDYTATSGTLAFAPGDTTKTITVAIIGDSIAEADETFSIQLSNAIHAELLDPQGKGTIENNEIVGTNNDDILLGTSGNDSIQGVAGSDRLLGQDGNDILNGDNDNDTLKGGLGNDHLLGQDGDDILVGNDGNDTLRGGSGKDRFVFDSPTNGVDPILDFQSGKIDLIEISASGFDSGLTANTYLKNSQFVRGTTASDRNDRLIYNSSTGELFFDLDGTGNTAQQQIATLTGAPTLSANNIFVAV